MEELIQTYNDKNLFKLICENFHLSEKIDLKQDSKSTNNSEYNFYYALFTTHILNKIKLITEQCYYIVVENEYTEHVWKEIFALHYTHTTYSNSNKVMRVHFFTKGLNKAEINQQPLKENYLGYITLRPVPDFNLMLSFIVPNWEILRYKQKCYIMTYEKKVHLFSYTIPIKTYEFYSQDTVVTTCAHADIIMFSTFVKNKYNYKLIKVSDIQDYTKLSPFPSEGLTAKEMLDIFRLNGTPVTYHIKKKIKKRGSTKQSSYTFEENYKEVLADCTNRLESHLESNLPVMVYNARHVVMVVGHTDTFPKKYIIYDDSGFFLHKVSGHNKVCKNYGFIGTVRDKDLFPNTNETTYLIGASHQRIYLTAEQYDRFLNEAIKHLGFDEDYKKKRSIIVDSAQLKSHLFGILQFDKNLDDILKENIKNLIYIDLPHYLWYTEIELDNNSMYILIGDATYPFQTNLDIFILQGVVSSNHKLKLLTLIQESSRG